MEEDWPEVGSVLKNVRHTFDKWRYFKQNVGGRSMSAMIDTDQAFALAKAVCRHLDSTTATNKNKMGLKVFLGVGGRIVPADPRPRWFPMSRSFFFSSWS